MPSTKPNRSPSAASATASAIPNGWRSLIKSVTWRLVGSLDTFILSWIVTRRLRYAVSIASVEALTKIVLYFVHERVWRRVAWGRLD